MGKRRVNERQTDIKIEEKKSRECGATKWLCVRVCVLLLFSFTIRRAENINLSTTWKAYVFQIGTSQCRYETLSLGIQCLCDVNATKWSFMGKLERKTLCVLHTSSSFLIACNVRFHSLSFSLSAPPSITCWCRHQCLKDRGRISERAKTLLSSRSSFIYWYFFQFARPLFYLILTHSVNFGNRFLRLSIKLSEASAHTGCFMRGALCPNAKKLKIDISLRPGFVEKSCSCEFGKAEKSGHHYSVQKITRNHNYFNIHVFFYF